MSSWTHGLMDFMIISAPRASARRSWTHGLMDSWTHGLMDFRLSLRRALARGVYGTRGLHGLHDYMDFMIA
jgi:hypothetical protein